MTATALSPGLAALLLFGGFFLLLILRVPVAFALGLSALPVLVIEPRLSPMVLFNEMFKAYNSFILLAVRDRRGPPAITQMHEPSCRRQREDRTKRQARPQKWLPAWAPGRQRTTASNQRHACSCTNAR